jgi:adenosylmethionine-8-amino-7-oxononanoate aminotransferase
VTDSSARTQELRDSAGAHLWRHFSELPSARRRPLTVFERGDGCYLVDTEGRRYLDALSNLFCVNIGYGYGDEIAEAAAAQYRQLPYHSSWDTTHPRAIELAERVASLAPDGFQHVFFTPSGGESVEAAWKLVRQYHRLRGEHRPKAIARRGAYHGTTMGALSLNGLAELRDPFEPLLGGVSLVSNTRRLERPAGETEEQFTAALLAELEHTLLAAGPRSVGMVILEPIQNHGGMLVPPAGYLAGVRRLCDRYGALLVADETITAWGRLGGWFGGPRMGMEPDIITTAKGLSSAYAVIGAVLVHDRVFETFDQDGRVFLHGNTFGAHPVSAAVALKNLEIMERLDLPGRVRTLEGELERSLRSLEAIPLVREIRGAGFFYGIELATSGPDGALWSKEKVAELTGDEMLADEITRRGVLLRFTRDTGDPVLCVAPPLVAGPTEFTLITDVLTEVLTNLAHHAGYR